MKLEFSKSILLQLGGLLLGFFTIVVLGRWGGKAVVGEFSTYKAMNDFVVGAASFGLPQAFALHIRRLNHGADRLYALSLAYSGGIGALFLCTIWIFDSKLAALTPNALTGWHLWAAAAALAIFTATSIMRGILLATSSNTTFSAASAMPNAMIFLAAVTLFWMGDFSPSAIYMCAAVITMAFSVFLLWDKVKPPKSQQKLDWQLLWKQSGNTFLQSILYGAVNYLSFSLLARQTDGAELSGLFGVASLAVILPTSLLALVAPLMFIEWAGSLTQFQLKDLKWSLAKFAVAAQLLALLAFPLSRLVIVAIWGEAFAPSAAAANIMALGVGAFVYVRLLTPAFQSQALHAPLNLAFVLRLILILGIYLALLTVATPVTALAGAWSLAELGVVCVIVAWPTKTSSP